MKFATLLFVLFFGFNGFAQEQSKTCYADITKEELLENPIHQECFDSYTKETISTLSYKIKFPDHPSLIIRNDSLVRKFRFYVETAKMQDQIVVFDIKFKKEIDAAPKAIMINLKSDN